MTRLVKPIPVNLRDALDVLDSELTTQQRRAILQMSRQHACEGLGPLLNPDWHLADADSPLVAWFSDQYGLRHSHDISRLIMDALWSRVQRLPTRTGALANVFRKEREILGRDPLTMVDATAAASPSALSHLSASPVPLPEPPRQAVNPQEGKDVSEEKYA